MKLKVIATAAVVLAPLPAHATEKTKAVLFGFGVKRCTEYIDSVKQYGNPVAMSAYSWAQGYMTAINTWRNSLHKPWKYLNATSVDSQIATLGSYCVAHPSKLYLDGVADLFASMPDLAPGE